MVKIAVLGYGTIGSGVVEALDINRDVIRDHAGEDIQVKYVLDLRDFPGSPIESMLVHDYDVIVNDPEVDIVVEVMGGTHPAYEYVKAALEAGKSVCTSNKALVADFGPELIALAKEKNVNFLFEASVGGGIPIIRPILSSLNVDTIHHITGILNGTTNYILTKMFEEGSTYEAALKTAQELGYAEADPTADVDGFDAARKIAILSSLIYGKTVDFNDITTEGIRTITDVDMKYAKALGKKIKLLGITYNLDGKIYSEVAPHMIDKSHMLYMVDDVMNGIETHGNLLGDTMFYGAGAGKLPTASAVVSDIIDEVKHLHVNVPIKWDAEPAKLEDHKTHWSKFFVRCDAEYEELKTMFKIEQLLTLADLPDEYAIVTEQLTFEEFDAILTDRTHIRNIIQVK